MRYFSFLGANASAEGGDDGGADDDTITGADVVLAHRLSATGFDKKGWTVYIKDFMKVTQYFYFIWRNQLF